IRRRAEDGFKWHRRGLSALCFGEDYWRSEQGRTDARRAGGVISGAGGRPDGRDHVVVPGGRLMASMAGFRPRSSRRRTWCGALAVLALAALACLAAGFDSGSARAQEMLSFPPRPKPPARGPSPLEPTQPGGEKQMLVRASEVDYDYTNERVSAVGDVQIYYGSSTVEADRVIYDQKTKRLHAE